MYRILSKMVRGVFSPARAKELDSRFEHHYREWRDKRVQCVIDHYGTDFFKGKTVLELGCGYGDIGARFAALGADVTCTDAREEHLAALRRRYPFLKTARADLDAEWPFAGTFDVILHLGTLYHLKHFEQPLIRACASAEHLVLETEVCDSDNPAMILFTSESGYDQAFNGAGNRPSPAYVERVLKQCGMRYELLGTSAYDTKYHTYNWRIQNTNAWKKGLRRIWFAHHGEQ